MEQSRQLFFLGFFVIVALLCFSMYLQWGVGLEPCPLCVLQRIVFFIMGLIFFIAGVHDPRRVGRFVYSGFIIGIGGLGVALSGRHVWIEFIPNSISSSCGASLAVLMANFPVKEIVQFILQGAGDCSKVTWRFLGLSIAMWSLLSFLCLTFIGLIEILFFCKKTPKRI